MYAGRIVEYADVVRLFSGHRHPYTAGLFASLPRACVDGTKGRLQTIRGVVPDLLALPQGCSFADRCPEVFAKCRERIPDLMEVEAGHWVRCWLYA